MSLNVVRDLSFPYRERPFAISIPFASGRGRECDSSAMMLSFVTDRVQSPRHCVLGHRVYPKEHRTCYRFNIVAMSQFRKQYVKSLFDGLDAHAMVAFILSGVYSQETNKERDEKNILCFANQGARVFGYLARSDSRRNCAGSTEMHLQVRLECRLLKQPGVPEAALGHGRAW